MAGRPTKLVDAAAPPPGHWLNRVPETHREACAKVLGELSRIRAQHSADFSVIGAFSLVFRDALDYVALWDIDLLFEDETALNRFRAASTQLRCFDHDRHLVRDVAIASVHTSWESGGQWVNVDLILRPGRWAILGGAEAPLFEEELAVGEERVRIALPVAQVGAIFVEKASGPRFRRALELDDPLCCDVRHVWFILERIGVRDAFWSEVVRLARRAGVQAELAAALDAVSTAYEHWGFELDSDVSEALRRHMSDL